MERPYMNTVIDSDLQNLIADLLRNPVYNHRPTMPAPRINRPTPQRDINHVYLHAIRETMGNFNTNIAEYQRNMQNYIRETHVFLELIRDMTRNTVSSNENIPPMRSRHVPARQTFSNRHPFRASHPIHNPLSYLLFPSLDLSGNRQYIAQQQPLQDLTSLFQDVIITPSEEEIDRSTELFEYNPTMELTNTQCPITLEEFQEGDQVRRIRHCGHCFKRTSFDGWFETNVRCPICRFDIRTYTEQQLTEVSDNDSNNMDVDDDDNDDDDDDNDDDAIQYGTTTSTTFTTQRQEYDISGVVQNLNEVFENVSSEITSVLTQYIQDALTNTPTHSYRIEIPITMSEEFDASDNLINRSIFGSTGE